MSTREAPDGYEHLRDAFRAAIKVTDTVRIEILGAEGGTWDVDPSTRENGGCIDICDGRRVAPDSTLVGTFGGLLRWRGGHTLPDGSQTVRFNHDGAAMTVRWRPKRTA